MMIRPTLVTFMLLLQACGTMRLQALPEPAAELDRERQAINTRLGDVQVTVQANAWDARPRRLIDAYLPFLIGIVNHGQGAVSLRLSEVTMIDDHGRPRRPFRPEEVISLLLGGSDPSAVVPSLDIGATGPEPTIFGLELGLDFNRNRDLQNIQRLALPPGPIAGSRAEGFIYFPKPPSDARRLTLNLILDAPSGPHPMSFSFAIEN